jgi:hypothetical protein
MRKKLRLKINNKMRGILGRTDTDTNRIEINVKKHKGDRAELASTIKHELMHQKHPHMTEKKVYKKTAKTKIPYGEQQRLLAKLRHKTSNYKKGALKRKFKMKKSEKVSAGSFINKANEKKLSRKERVSIMGLV